jgi:hypothetical protein
MLHELKAIGTCAFWNGLRRGSDTRSCDDGIGDRQSLFGVADGTLEGGAGRVEALSVST